MELVPPNRKKMAKVHWSHPNQLWQCQYFGNIWSPPKKISFLHCIVALASCERLRIRMQKQESTTNWGDSCFPRLVICGNCGAVRCDRQAMPGDSLLINSLGVCAEVSAKTCSANITHLVQFHQPTCPLFRSGETGSYDTATFPQNACHFPSKADRCVSYCKKSPPCESNCSSYTVPASLLLWEGCWQFDRQPSKSSRQRYTIWHLCAVDTVAMGYITLLDHFSCSTWNMFHLFDLWWYAIALNYATLVTLFRPCVADQATLHSVLYLRRM